MSNSLPYAGRVAKASVTSMVAAASNLFTTLSVYDEKLATELLSEVFILAKQADDLIDDNPDMFKNIGFSLTIPDEEEDDDLSVEEQLEALKQIRVSHKKMDRNALEKAKRKAKVQKAQAEVGVAPQ